MEERYTVRFVCGARAAPECTRRAQRFSMTFGLDARRPRIDAAAQSARAKGWRLSSVRKARPRPGEVYAVCPSCAAARPDAGPPEALHLLPDPPGQDAPPGPR